MLAGKGAVVIDADEVARFVVEPGQPALAALVEHFGLGILGADGSLDRPALAALAFVDDESRAQLDAITHPAIRAEFGRRIESTPADAVVVYDVPLLVESPSGRSTPYAAVIVVEAPRELRLERLEARGVSRPDAGRRMAAQATDEQRRAVATYVIDNGADLDALAVQVDRVWDDLTLRAKKAASTQE